MLCIWELLPLVVAVYGGHLRERENVCMYVHFLKYETVLFTYGHK